MTSFLLKIAKDERGQDTIEYALFVGVVAAIGISFCSGHGISIHGVGTEGMDQLAALNLSAAVN